MNKVVMYTTRFCPYCLRARFLLEQKSVEFEEIGVDFNRSRRMEMIEKSSRTSVPQIWIGEMHVGGCDELFMLERQGKLDNLLWNL
ncbi:MAG: glutaredoxin 3 [bacterium]|nr:glutaredoxin 3 [Gammaproteobacteria bacterium]HIL95347.1 glutaredoxin 3 [Pseudomonadales bacterium]